MSDNRRFYSRTEQQTEVESRALEEKTRMHTRGSSSTDSGVMSPPPISLGNRAKVDLKGKQRFFEEREKATDKAAPSARMRPKSWGPGEMDKLTRRKDASFKDKHLKYEQLQRQADTESATLQGKIRPQLSVDSRDGPSKPKGVLPSRVDVQLGDKRRKFEKLDYQAQKDSAVLRGEQRDTVTDGKNVRRKSSGNADSKLRNKQNMFESLERQASEDMETLQGKRRLSTSDREHNKRASGVFLPKEANVKLGDKKSKFEELDHQAKKESNILRLNQSRSTGSLAKEPHSYGNYYRPREEMPRFSNEGVFLEREPVARHNDYGYQESSNMAPNIKDVRNWQAVEEPMECTPDTSDGRSDDQEYGGSEAPSWTEVTPQGTEEAPRKLGRTALFTQQRYGRDSFDFDDQIPPYYLPDDPIQPESASVAQTAPEPEVQSSSRHDSAQPLPREKHEGVLLKKQSPIDEIDYKPRKEQKSRDRATEEDDRPYSGGFSYNDYVPVPKGGQRKQRYLQELKRESGPTEMPWRQEVRELKDRPQGGEILPPRQLNRQRISAQESGNPARGMASLKRDAYLREVEREKDVQEMPWRQEVKELKELSPREEDQERQEVPTAMVQSPGDPDIRKMKYRDFAIAPHKSVKRDRFVSQEQDDMREEMPWRQELRELKDRPPTEEPIEPSSGNVTESAYNDEEVKFSYRDFVPMKQASLKRNEYLRDNDRPQSVEEMPWRQEVRELKRNSSAKEHLTDDEHVPDTVTDGSPSVRKMSYRDISRAPTNRNRDTFVRKSETANEEMPWRAEVRELRNRGPREDIQDEDRDNRNRGRPPRPKSSSAIDGRKLSYHDFACPPSMMNREHSQEESKPRKDAPKKRYKVQDLTRRFTEIEADQSRPKQGGVPSQKSLVNKDELERIEREMKTRTWHGFPTGYSDHENRRSSLPDEDSSSYRPADISADNYRDVFEDPEVLFQKQEAPTDVYQEPVVQSDPTNTHQVDVGYEVDPFPHAERQNEEGRFPRDEPEQRPVDRYHAWEYPTKRHKNEHPSFHGQRQQPIWDTEYHTYQQQPERDLIHLQETPALNSMPEQPTAPEQRPPAKGRGNDTPRGSSKNRTVYLWSSEDSQEPPVQQFDQINLNSAPIDTDGKREFVVETRDWAQRDAARNGVIPPQHHGQEYEYAPKNVAPNAASDMKERPLRIRSNVFAIVGNNSQGPRPSDDPHRSLDRAGVSNPAQQGKVWDRDVHRAPRSTEPRVLDINEEQVDHTRHADEGYPFDWPKGSKDKLNDTEILKDDKSMGHAPQQVYMKNQLRDADYRAKLRDELMATNRKQRESAKYLLSQVQASYSSDGGESDENGKFNSEMEGPVHDDQSRYPQVNYREQHFDRFHGSSNPNVREVENNALPGEDPDIRTRDWTPPQKQNPTDVVVEPVIEPSEKPSQTFSLNEELSVIFREDSDPYARLAGLHNEPETNGMFHGNPMRINGWAPTENRAYRTTKGEMSNGYHRYDANYNFDRNGYGGQDYSEPIVHSQRKGLKEERKSKATDWPQEQQPPGRGYAVLGRHSMQYAPVEFKPDTKDPPPPRNGPLTNGYPRSQRSPKMDDPRETEEPKRPNRNGSTGYNVYETFVHGESNHVVCEYCGTTIEKSPSMFVAEVNKYWHLHCFQCVVCQSTFNEHSGQALRITNSRLHCERCFITDEGERCTEV